MSVVVEAEKSSEKIDFDVLETNPAKHAEIFRLFGILKSL